jgi:hypothetical protein
MTQLNNGLQAFYGTLQPAFQNRVTLATWSEFGRTVYSNDSDGSDHGSMCAHFVIGSNVKGGQHFGAMPSLAMPNRWARPAHTVDFRSLFGSFMDSWLGGGGQAVLGGSFENLNLFTAGPGDPPPGGGGGPVIVQPPSIPTHFHALSPARLFDTRDGTGIRAGALAGGQTVEVQVSGLKGVPADAVAVAFNLTSVDATSPTYVTAWPTGQARPSTSNLNPVPGRAVPNIAVVRLGGGKISLYNHVGSAHLLGDVVGYFTGGGDLGLVPLIPARLLDTRDGTGGIAGAIGGRGAVDLQVTGRGGVPDDAKAVVLNVTVTEPTEAGYITVWPTGQTRPVASSVNMIPGQTVPNLVMARIGDGGKVSFYNHAGSSHLVVDVLGAYVDDGAGHFVAVTPSRVLDTRDGTGAPLARLGQAPLNVGVLGRGGVPGSDVTAVLLNVTAVAPTADTYLTVWPTGGDRPLASNLNVPTGAVIPNGVLASVGVNGQVSLFNFAGTVDVVADVVGYYTDSH